MKKKLLIVSILAGLIFLGGTQIWAVPTISGPTGLITVPTAEAVKYKEIDLGFDYNFAGNPSGNVSQNTYYYKILIGIFKGWELGITGGSTPTDAAYINVKYSLVSDTSRFPFSVAIGLQNLPSTSLSEIYLAASKRFEGGISAHLGFKTDFIKIQPSIMAGAEYYFSEQLSILADICGKERTYRINGGVRFFVLPDLVLKGSVIDIGEQNMSYNVGIAYQKYF